MLQTHAKDIQIWWATVSYMLPTAYEAWVEFKEKNFRQQSHQYEGRNYTVCSATTDHV